MILVGAAGPLAKAQESTAGKIQGHWTRMICYTYSYAETNPMLSPDASHWTTCNRSNLLVKGDSIWFFEYPCKFYRKSYFEIKNGDSIYFDQNKKAQAHLKVEGDFIHLSTNDYHRSERWIKDSFDHKILQQLIRDSLNFSCLTGKLRLMTEYHGSEDGSYFECRFPLNLPAFVDLNTAKKAGEIFQSKKIDLSIDGIARPFTVNRVEWNENAEPRNPYNNFQPDWKKDEYPRIFLSPGNWWKGFPFELEYRGIEDGGSASGAELKQVVKAKYPVWINLPVFKQEKNQEMENLGKILEAAGCTHDPFIMRQHYAERSDNYQEYWNLTPVQSGNVIYYQVPLDSHCVLKINRQEKLPKRGKRKNNFDSIDFTPVLKVKKICSYYFTKKDTLRQNLSDIDDGMVEVWEFKSKAEALQAKSFFDRYLNEAVWGNDVLLGYAYGRQVTYSIKGNYLYCVYTRTWWRDEKHFAAITKEILK